MNLLNKCFNRFSIFFKIFKNEESDYSEENTSDKEDFCLNIIQPFHFEFKQDRIGIE